MSDPIKRTVKFTPLSCFQLFKAKHLKDEEIEEVAEISNYVLIKLVSEDKAELTLIYDGLSIDETKITLENATQQDFEGKQINPNIIERKESEKSIEPPNKPENFLEKEKIIGKTNIVENLHGKGGDPSLCPFSQNKSNPQIVDLVKKITDINVAYRKPLDGNDPFNNVFKRQFIVGTFALWTLFCFVSNIF